MNILVYVDSLDGKPTTVARELVSGARQLAGGSGRVTLAYFGNDVAAVHDLDADQILAAPASDQALYNPQSHTFLLVAAIEATQPDLILLGYTTSGLDLGPVVAIQRNLPLLCYCTAIRLADGKVSVDNQVYGGKLIATTEANLPAVLLVNAGAFSEGATGQSRQTEVSALPAGPVASRLTFASATQPDLNAVDITKATRLLCVGRGIGDEDAIVEAREAAGLMGGELVGSRPIIDIGWLPKERQVGKSGRKVKPQLYVALGVSGAPEHIEGMGASGCIVAINTDAKAPIFDHAHIGAHVDVGDFLSAFKDALSQRAR